MSGGRKGKTVNASDVKRRPSFEIARDYIILNFKPIIEAEAEENLSKKELSQKRRAERQENKRRHLVRNSVLGVLLLIAIVVGVAFVWWNSSNEPVNALDKNARQFVVDEGATTDQVATALQNAGFIRSTLAFRICA